MTPGNRNDTFIMPAEEAGPAHVANEIRPITPEELRKDRQALSDEATRLAISASREAGNPPLYIQTEMETAERPVIEITPEAKALKRLSSSIGIMQDGYINKLFSGQGMRDFSFTELSTAMPSILGGRKPSDTDREKVRSKLIEQETLLSEKVFEKHPELKIPENQRWLLQHSEGHFYWFIYDKTSQNPEPQTIVHYNTTATGAEKTVKFSDESRNRYPSVGKGELQKLIQLFNSYENVVAQKIYHKVAGRHHPDYPA